MIRLFVGDLLKEAPPAAAAGVLPGGVNAQRTERGGAPGDVSANGHG